MNGQDGIGVGACRPVETVARDAERKAFEAFEAFRLAVDNKQTLSALLALIGEAKPEETGPPLKGHPTTVTRVHGHPEDGFVVELGMDEQDVAGELSIGKREPWMEVGKRVLIYVQEIEEA